jgi:hypothetical protein
MQIPSLVPNDGYFLYNKYCYSSEEISFINSRNVSNFGISWNITNIAEMRAPALNECSSSLVEKMDWVGFAPTTSAY